MSLSKGAVIFDSPFEQLKMMRSFRTQSVLNFHQIGNLGGIKFPEKNYHAYKSDTLKMDAFPYDDKE